MTTRTTSYDAHAGHPPMLRRLLAGAAAFDAAGGAFCLAAAGELASWLAIPRTSAYITGALFLVAGAAGGLALRRDPLRVAPIVAANEIFAVWCLAVLGADDPNALGVALFVVAALSSAGTGAVEHLLARRGRHSPRSLLAH